MINLRFQQTLKNSTTIFFWFLLTLTIFYSGHLYSNDDLLKAHSAKNLILKKSTSVLPEEGGWGTINKEGKTYPNFPLGMIISVIPSVVSALILEALFDVKWDTLISPIMSFQNVIITALLSLIVYLLLTQNNLSKKKSFIWANIILFSTEIFSYSSTGWSEPAAAMLILSSIYFLNKSLKEEKNRTLLAYNFLIIFSLSVSLTIRIEYSLFILFFLLLSFFTEKKNANVVIPILISLVIATSINLAYNYVRFDSFLNFGYLKSQTSNSTTETFKLISVINPLRIHSIYLILFSFGRLHLFWAAPLVLSIPFVLFKNKEIPNILKSLFIASILFSPFLWRNSWCWANRYAFILIPFLLIPLPIILNKTDKISRFIKSLIILGIIVSFSGKIINFHIILEEKVDTYGYDTALFRHASDFKKAPVFTHISRMPSYTLNTSKTILFGVGNKDWYQIRKENFDIWPVNFYAHFKRGRFLFLLAWILLIVLDILLFRMVALRLGISILSYKYYIEQIKKGFKNS